MGELNPCPFCGGNARVLEDGLPYVVIECEDCFCRTNCHVTKQDAMHAWNTRTPLRCIESECASAGGNCSWCVRNYFSDNYEPKVVE